jgi:hypothetical protein
MSDVGMTATKQHWSAKLKAKGACSDALAWCKGFRSVKAAWLACERGDWMLWILGRLSGDPDSDSRKAVVLAACACARLALPHWHKRHPDDKRPLTAIETTERWARGEPGVTLDDVRAARTAVASAAASAAAAAASVASAAAAAAYAASAAASVVAAYAADADAARFVTLKQCAEIVRKHFPEIPGWARAALLSAGGRP